MSNGAKMNLKQKAKKKLVGSFSKRKKLKITDGENYGEEDAFELPPPLPRTRPPIPDFSGAQQEPLGESVASLTSSFSLPALLDQSGVGDAELEDNDEDANRNSDEKGVETNARQHKKLTKTKSALQLGEKVTSKNSKNVKSGGKTERVESFRYTYFNVYNSVSDENLASSEKKPEIKPHSRPHSAILGMDPVTSASSSSPSSSPPPILSSSSGYHSSSTSDLSSHVPVKDKKLRRMMSDQQLVLKTSSNTTSSAAKKSVQWFKKQGKFSEDRTVRNSCGEGESQDSCDEKLTQSSISPSSYASNGRVAKFNMGTSVPSSADSGDSFEQDFNPSTESAMEISKNAQSNKSPNKQSKKGKKQETQSFFKKTSQKFKKTNNKKVDASDDVDKPNDTAVSRRRSRGETTKALDPRHLRRDKSSDAIRRSSSPCDKTRSRSCHARLGPRAAREDGTDWSDYDNLDNDSDHIDKVDDDEGADGNDGDNDLDDTDGEGTLVAPDEDRILTQDIGIFEEVFEPTEDDISMVIVSQLDNSLEGSDTTLDFTLSSDDREDFEEGRFMPRCVEESMLAKRRKKVRASRKLEKRHSHRKNVPSDRDSSVVLRKSSSVKKSKDDRGDNNSSTTEPKEPLSVDTKAASSPTTPCIDLPRIPRMDNSVLNKIKFFENFSEITGITSPPMSTRSNSPMPSPSPSPSSSFNAGNQVSLFSGKTLNARLAAYLNSHKDMTMWTSSPRRPVSARGVVGERGLSPSLSPHRGNKRSNSDSTATTSKTSYSSCNSTNKNGDNITKTDNNFSGEMSKNVDATGSNRYITSGISADNKNNNNHNDDESDNINNNSNSNTTRTTNDNNDNNIGATSIANNAHKAADSNINAVAFKSWTFTNSNPRLNFSKFRRSGSIPEAVAVDSYSDDIWFTAETAPDTNGDLSNRKSETLSQVNRCYRD